MGAKCYRAASGMFRSVLEKSLQASGYKVRSRISLYKMIELAAEDGVITKSRQRRTHDDIRVLGNDVLHDKWKAVALEDVAAAHHYTQRILEDLYDDRDSVLSLLRSKGRVPEEDQNRDDQ